METQNRKLFNIYFFVIAFANLGSSMMVQMFNSTITLHIDSLNYSASISGTIISIGAVAATVYRFFGGKMCEKNGRRNLIIIGTVIFAVMSFALGQVRSLPLMYLVRVMQMFGYSMANTSLSVAIVDVIPKKRIGEGLGYYTLAASIAQAIGPSIALVLFYNYNGFASVMFGSAIIGLISAAITFFLMDYEKKDKADSKIDTTEKTEDTYKGIWKYIEKKALTPAWIYFFVCIAGNLVMMYLTLYASRMNIENSGVFFTISVIFMILARLISGRISDTKGVLWAVIPGSLCMVLGFVLLLLSSSILTLFFVAGAFYGLGMGMSAPALNAQAVKSVSKDRVSIASSTFFLPMDISFMAGSLLWGVVIDNFSFTVSFISAAVLSGIAMIVSIIVFGPGKQKR